MQAVKQWEVLLKDVFSSRTVFLKMEMKLLGCLLIHTG